MNIESVSFPVFARDRSAVPASVDADPTPNAIALARGSVGFALAAATQLKQPTGRYNCHGLVFASRRANTPAAGAEVDVDDLLRRDGYVQVVPPQVPQVGDVVAYRLDGEIEHTGFVSRAERVGDTPVVFVWSAWGCLGEFEHRVQASPYRGTPEYWRLK